MAFIFVFLKILILESTKLQLLLTDCFSDLLLVIWNLILGHWCKIPVQIGKEIALPQGLCPERGSPEEPPVCEAGCQMSGIWIFVEKL